MWRGAAISALAAPKLNRFFKKGDGQISNNACENTTRPRVVRHKTLLLSTSASNAKASANRYRRAICGCLHMASRPPLAHITRFARSALATRQR
ncbi:MAG: IS66 family transposase [Ralstonia sp.]|uniref:IS66 family transposase n=1 Tax=Ralstonia sp. TaxID=54061 RepID=UPI003F7E3C70